MIDDHGIKRTWLESVADDIQQLACSGHEIIVVSSGAIGLGRKILQLGKKRLRLPESQAAAAIGQIELSRIYRDVFNQRGIVAGQILVTIEDTEQRRRYLNARATLESLLDLGVVPVVNENDTIATTEIRYGDNDRLSARVATMISAHLLILLSDIDGLYTGHPSENDSQFVPIVESIDEKIECMAGGARSDLGTGGMLTKIQAAKIATQAGTQMIIASGLEMNPISRLSQDARHTTFKATETPISARKKWIVSDLADKGSVVVDAGAANAIRNNKSLLPVGVLQIMGEFGRGDVIQLNTTDGVTLARGISNYDFDEATQIAGKRTDQLHEVLGYQRNENLVHRDNMVVIENKDEPNE